MCQSTRPIAGSVCVYKTCIALMHLSRHVVVTHFGHLAYSIVYDVTSGHAKVFNYSYSKVAFLKFLQHLDCLHTYQVVEIHVKMYTFFVIRSVTFIVSMLLVNMLCTWLLSCSGPSLCCSSAQLFCVVRHCGSLYDVAPF